MGARTRAHTHPNTPARSGGAQPTPEPKHTRPRRGPQPGVAGCKQSAHTSTHTAQHPSQEWRGVAETRAQTHTPTARTPARSGGVQAERPHQHTHSPTPEPGVAGRSRNPSPNTHTRGGNPSQEWQGASGAPTPAHTHPNSPARSGGVQPKPEPKHTHPHHTYQPGVAGYKVGTHTSTHTPQHPSQEWRGAAEIRAQTHTPAARTPARSGGVQAERPHQHTHSQTPQPGVAGCSRNPSPNTHTHGVHPSQEWRGAGRASTTAHTQPNTPARDGGVQPKPEPKHTHPTRAPQPGVAGCKRGALTSTHTAKHPSQEWRVAAETRAQTHTPPPHTPARSGWVQGGHAHKHAHPNTPARSGGAQPKPEPKHTHPSRAPRPGVAGYGGSRHTNTHTPTPQHEVSGRSRNLSPNTHTHTAHPTQEWRGASGARARGDTQPNTPARSGGAQPKPKPKHIHPHRAPQPGVAGCKRSTHRSTHTAQQPSQEWRGAAETRAQARTPKPHTPAERGGVQEEHTHQHTHTPTSEPGVAGRSQNPSPNTQTHTAHPSQEWRSTMGASTGAHTNPNTPARSCGAQPIPEPKHTHPRRVPQPGVAGCRQSEHTSTHTVQHPTQEWRGAAETRAQTHTPTARNPARSGGGQAERPHQHTHTPTPQRGVRLEVSGLILRVLDAFRPRGATWSGQVISSPPGPSGRPSKTHLPPGGGVPRVHRARSPVPPLLPHFATPSQCINSQSWLRAVTHRVAPLMCGRPGRRRRRARATGLSPVGPPWASAEAA